MEAPFSTSGGNYFLTTSFSKIGEIPSISKSVNLKIKGNPKLHPKNVRSIKNLQILSRESSIVRKIS
jgi:hypothetical protein